MRLGLRLSLALLTLLLVAPLRAATFVVSASGMSFTPANLTITAGDSVRFENHGGFHNVAADDSSFRNGEASSDAWTFTRTFDSPGSVGYHCEVHGSPGAGMHGTITINPAGGGEVHNGTLQLSAGAYSVNEGTAQATISVTRTGGDDGAVSVHFATSGQSATAGSDFTAAAGTLSWTDHDSATKTFNVAIKNDTVVEPNETVLLTLSSPTGGAVLGIASAVLTIADNDAAGSPPAAPINLRTSSTSTTGVVLAWQDKSNNETGFRVQSRGLHKATYTDVGVVAANTTTLAVNGLPEATPFFFRVRAENGSGVSAFAEEILVSTDTTPFTCVADANTLCINNGRFSVKVDWAFTGASGHGVAVPLPASPDSGLFYFFDPGNIEMLIKVLNACTIPSAPRYWAFFAATTTVELTVTVTDSQSGKIRTYFNPLNRPAPPVQDTDAFATCP